MNRSTNYNFYLPTNADPIRISDLTFNYEQIDDYSVSVLQQSFTNAEKTQARTNIGAASASDVTTVNSRLTTAISPNSLVLTSNATSSSQAFYTYDSRKFSDYRMLVFVLYTSSSDKTTIRQVVQLPSYLWDTGRSVMLIQNHGTGLSSVSGVQIRYDSDTSVRAFTVGDGALTGFEIVGYLRG